MARVEVGVVADVDDQRLTLPAPAGSPPRLRATIASRFGGCGPRPSSSSATKASSPSMASSGLWRRS